MHLRNNLYELFLSKKGYGDKHFIIGCQADGRSNEAMIEMLIDYLYIEWDSGETCFDGLNKDIEIIEDYYNDQFTRCDETATINKNNVIYTDDYIIGSVAAIIEDTEKHMNECNDAEIENTGSDLLKELETIENDCLLIKCYYHPMGAWVVTRLLDENGDEVIL